MARASLVRQGRFLRVLQAVVQRVLPVTCHHLVKRHAPLVLPERMRAAALRVHQFLLVITCHIVGTLRIMHVQLAHIAQQDAQILYHVERAHRLGVPHLVAQLVLRAGLRQQDLARARRVHLVIFQRQV